MFNSNLDRGTLFGVHGQEGLGFLEWASQNPIEQEATGVAGTPSAEGDGMTPEIRNSNWASIYKDSDSSELQELIAEFVQSDIPVAEWGKEAGEDNQWQTDLAWPQANVAVVLDDDEDRDDWLAAQGHTVLRSRDYVPADLAEMLLDILS